MLWLVFLTISPTLFFMLTWVLVTAVRVLKQEKPGRMERASTFVHRTTRTRKAVAVAVKGEEGSRDDDAKYYTLSRGWSSGIPESWHSELWIRRN